MTSTPLRAAVIGVGYLGRFHARKYAAMEGVKLVAVADASRERAEALAQELGVEARDDYRTLLGEVDLVSVVTPTRTHFEVAAECLRAGVHVLLEKPMTVTVAEADGLVALAEARGVVLQVGHLKRFHPAIDALRRSGLLKTPRLMEGWRLAPFKGRALDVDVVLDLMIHDVDLVLDFAGAEVVEVEAMGGPVLTGDIDAAWARLKFANGSVAVLHASRAAMAARRELHLYQEDAAFEVDFIARQARVTRATGGRALLEGVEVTEVVRELLPVGSDDTLEAQIRDFRDAVLQNRPPRVDGRAGRHALAVTEEIRRRIHAFAVGVAPGRLPPMEPGA